MKDTTTATRETRNDMRIRDFILPFLVLVEWFLLGIFTPVVKEMLDGFDPYGESFDWPYPYILCIHWSWSIPFGIAIGAAILLRHRYLSRRFAQALSILGWVTLTVVPLLWWWGIIPHRMVQYAG
jgi:hypothetical protein